MSLRRSSNVEKTSHFCRSTARLKSCPEAFSRSLQLVVSAASLDGKRRVWASSDVGSVERLKVGFGISNALETDFAAQNDHGFKKRRRIFAAADRDSYRLEHRSRLESERGGGFAQSFIQRVVIERSRGQ